MTACGDTVFRRTQLLGGLTKEYRNAAKPPPRPDRPWSNPGAQILKPHTLTWTVQVWVEGIGVSRSPLAGWAALAWVGFIARAAVCESLSPPSSAGPPGPAGKRWPANTARPSPALADCTCVVGGVVVSPLVDPVSGWLAGRLGDAWLNLLHGSPDERLVRRGGGGGVFFRRGGGGGGGAPRRGGGPGGGGRGGGGPPPRAPPSSSRPSTP